MPCDPCGDPPRIEFMEDDAVRGVRPVCIGVCGHLDRLPDRPFVLNEIPAPALSLFKKVGVGVAEFSRRHAGFLFEPGGKFV